MKLEYPFSCPPAGQPAAVPPRLTPEVAGAAISPGTSILVADDLPLFRRGLLEVLAQAFASCSLYEAASSDELLALAGYQRPTLVLLAANLVKTPAAMLAMLRQLRQQHAPVSIVLFIDPAAGFERASLRILYHKVSCLLTRAASPTELCDSIRAVLHQGHHHSEPTLALLQAPAPLPGLRTIGGFSARQLEVLRLIAEDLSNEEIADCLCTSVRTVEYHRSQMLHKMGIRTALGLVLLAQRQGLLPMPAGSPGQAVGDAPSGL